MYSKTMTKKQVFLSSFYILVCKGNNNKSVHSAILLQTILWQTISVNTSTYKTNKVPII